MTTPRKQKSQEACLICPQCQRQHQLGPANLLAGGKFRCPCGWTMRVVSHQREFLPRVKPAY